MSFVGYCCAREAVGNAEAVATEIEPCRNRRRFIFSSSSRPRPRRWTLYHPLQPGKHDQATGCRLVALSGRRAYAPPFPLLEVERTSFRDVQRSASDPRGTSGSRVRNYSSPVLF